MWILPAISETFIKCLCSFPPLVPRAAASPALAQAGERRDWAAPGLSWPCWDSGTEEREPWHCPLGDRVKSHSPPPLHLTGKTSSCTGCWLLPRVFFPSFPPCGTGDPHSPPWPYPTSPAALPGPSHRIPVPRWAQHPGLWKNPLNLNIPHFQGVGKPSALSSSEMALASSSSCRASDGFQRNNPFFRTDAWKCIWKATSGSFFSVKSVRLNRSDGKCWCRQECLHPEGSGHWAVSQRN